MSAALELEPTALKPPRPPHAQPGGDEALDHALAGIADDARRDPLGYLRDTRVPEGCE